jgi:hypothetical protein
LQLPPTARTSQRVVVHLEKKPAPEPAKESGAGAEGADPSSYQLNNGAQAQNGHGSRVLLDERPLVLLPGLAQAIGVDGAIVLQQLHYYLANPKCGRAHDGQQWIFNTYEQWQAHDFPFWPVFRVGQIFRHLERRGLLISCQPETRSDGACNRRKYYTINYEQLNAVVPSHYCETQRSEHCKTQRSRTKTTGPKKGHKSAKGARSLRRAATAFFWKEPKVPYPKTERGMYGTLERLGIDTYPDHDGSFFHQMREAGWRIGGRRVHDWPATYQARVEKILDGMGGGSWG